jgi:hypothetical protein
MADQGLVTYPGIVAWESFEITDLSGITPAVATMQVYPQEGFPDPEGDLVLTYGDNTIVFKNCHIDAAHYSRNGGGKIVQVRFLDERWKWKAGYFVTGRYNRRLPNNFVEPAHEKTPRELATLCFEALEVESFDVTALPNDARPDINWEHASAAEELAKLCDDLGCRIVPQRSTGIWLIVVTGNGVELPDEFPFTDAGEGIDPAEAPDFLAIVTAPIKFQCRLKLEAVGKDVDMRWRPLDELSYSPADRRGASVTYGFGDNSDEMEGISLTRTRQPDGSMKSPREFAKETLFRCFRVQEPTDGISIPGFPDRVKRKQLVLSDTLVEIYLDEFGGVHERKAFVEGAYQSRIDCPSNQNTPYGTRIDKWGSTPFAAQELITFTLAGNNLDTDLSMITFSQPMRMLAKYTTLGGTPALGRVRPAELWIHCAVQIRDPKTWQPLRYSRTLHIGSGDDEKFAQAIPKEDIQPWYRTDYTISANGSATFTKTDNKQEVDTQCDYYLESLAKTFETVGSSTRTYLGLFPIDLDGAIQQVSYRISKSGADTVASRGTEHNFVIPDYAERRQRDGRKSAAAQQKVVKYLTDNLARQGAVFY